MTASVICRQLEAELAAVKRELEEEKADHQHTLEGAWQLEKDWVQMKRERDALMFDFKCYVLKPRKVCPSVQNRNKPICNMCDGCDVFEWRGVQENGGAEDA